MNTTSIDVWYSLADFCVKYGPVISAILTLDLLLRLVAAWDALKQERGADRICWFLVLILTPIFGTAAYVCIALRERDERLNYAPPSGNGLREPSQESLSWAQAKLEKELNAPAKTEKEWLARYVKK